MASFAVEKRIGKNVLKEKKAHPVGPALFTKYYSLFDNFISSADLIILFSLFELVLLGYLINYLKSLERVPFTYLIVALICCSLPI